MIVCYISHGLAILVCVILGLAVCLTNPRRVTNQAYLLLSAFIVGWLSFLALGFYTRDAAWAKFCIKASTNFSIFLPLGINWIRASIKYPQKSLPALCLHAPVWLALAMLTMAVCLSDFYVRELILSPPDTLPYRIPEPVYGPGVFLFALYFTVSMVAVIVLSIRDVRQLQGLARTELQFILLGCALGLAYGFIVTLLVPLLWHSNQVIQIAPIGAILLNGVIAYGIATRRILEVAHLVRQVVAYTLLIGYLTFLYLVVWLMAEELWGGFRLPGSDAPHFIAAAVCAFSMLPTHGFFQRFATRLFINVAGHDVAQTIQKSGILLQTVTTVDDLLQRFHRILAEAVGTDAIAILVPEDGCFVQRLPVVNDKRQRPRFAVTAPLIRELAESKTPLVLDTAERIRSSWQQQEAVAQLHQAQASLALGVPGPSGLSAVLLLGPRLSGRIYSAVEQDMLQMLGSQLAAALENARLYTQVQDGKIYNELLLDRLVNGVIAINATGRIHVFNRESQRVTGLAQEAILGRPFNNLPGPLALIMTAIWEQGERVLGQEVQLHTGDIEFTLRAGGTMVVGHAGARLGALLVFSDITDIKRLELQIRRSDRLASVGALSAGMAHEIKNPLTALKAFVQLLPERYDDADFRATLAKLAPREIERIDGIVNRLLEFSRPVKPLLAEISLHEVILQPLELISEAAIKKEVVIEKQFSAVPDTLRADLHQLQQVILNFLLNALESIPGQGRIRLSTSRVEGAFRPEDKAAAAQRSYLRLDISDTGCGIPPDLLPRIFDPFFTTKTSGTGLGLSVSHGIILEHGGMVEVESRVGQGTTFHIYLPSHA